MKILIVYYSRSGNTKNMAKIIGNKLNADLEEVIDNKKRKGLFGFISSGNEAYLQKTIPIEKLSRDPALYDLVIIATPIWANNISTPVRSFLKEYQERIKKAAFLCTSLGSDPKNVFSAMEKILGQKPVAAVNFTKRDIKTEHHRQIIDEFIKNIRQLEID